MTPTGQQVLGAGTLTIPAHPLAVGDDGKPDWVSQRTLTQYYLAAGVQGLAVGVHTTQFEIHEDRDLLRRTLIEANDVVASAGREVKMVAGVVGDIPQAVAEAELAAELGYGSVLLSPNAVSDPSPGYALERTRAVAQVIPVLGFYMQDSVGGAYLPEDYWQELFSIEGVVGVKIAPFDRYRTRDVLAALAASGRTDDMVVLTGNDDTIVVDLVTPWQFGDQAVGFHGGLLGQWAVGTRAAVELTNRCLEPHPDGVPLDILSAGADLVSINEAVFDPHNGFAGSVSGINEMLRQQGLIKSSRCLSPREQLAPGQAELIAAARRLYPELLDEQFISDHLKSWRLAAA